jgi:hypothetical protein
MRQTNKRNKASCKLGWAASQKVRNKIAVEEEQEEAGGSYGGMPAEKTGSKKSADRQKPAA